MESVVLVLFRTRIKYGYIFYCRCPHAGVEKKGVCKIFSSVLVGEGGEFGDSVEASGDVLAAGSCCADGIY